LKGKKNSSLQPSLNFWTSFVVHTYPKCSSSYENRTGIFRYLVLYWYTQVEQTRLTGVFTSYNLRVKGVQCLYYLFYVVLISLFDKMKTFECLICMWWSTLQLQLENQASSILPRSESPSRYVTFTPRSPGIYSSSLDQSYKIYLS